MSDNNLIGFDHSHLEKIDNRREIEDDTNEPLLVTDTEPERKFGLRNFPGICSKDTDCEDDQICVGGTCCRPTSCRLTALPPMKRKW